MKRIKELIDMSRQKDDLNKRTKTPSRKSA